MADTLTGPVSLLMGLPLEVRHNIFEYAAARDIKPKKLFRNWFEKKELKELIAREVAANPIGPAPQVVYSNEYEEDSDVPEPEEAEAEEQEQDSDDEDEEDEEAEDGEDHEDQDEDSEDDEAGQDQDVGNDAQDNGVEPEEAEEGDEDPTEEDEGHFTQSNLQPSMAAPVPAQAQPVPTTTTQDAIPAQNQTNNQAQPADHPAMDSDGEVEVDEDGDQSMAPNDGEEDGQGEGEGEDGADVAENSDPHPPSAPVRVCASRKWRYIPNFMRITHCPPPASLLLTSKQLNDEAKNWFYDVAVLRISATNSFAHTSFFEEAFSQITEAAFSPIENIRRVEVMFVWDTTWLRADPAGFAEAVFPALLRQRSDFVHKILAQAPDLREVTIYWHDSAHDDQSTSFMLDVLAPFHDLNATVKIEEHYIAADAKPHKRSIAGKQRVQFQQIVDAGLARLF